jgi:hypothetical protein
MKHSNFRDWIKNIWNEHCEECSAWRETPLSEKDYFSRYKWWLRREYRHQNSDQFIQKD